jgi:hypothetical protein
MEFVLLHKLAPYEHAYIYIYMSRLPFASLTYVIDFTDANWMYVMTHEGPLMVILTLVDRQRDVDRMIVT